MKKDKLHSYTKLMKEFYKRTDIYSFQERMMLLKDYLEFNYSYLLNKKEKKIASLSLSAYKFLRQ